ncbi:MAG: translation elongation factor Ts [Flavobacteriales bacterium]|nr:translation elongation factor Ts [Flavobacteriales bacterium]
MSAVAISAAEVNKLRQTTGAGMMDCKNALAEAGGDFEKAIEILRKKGQKVADKRSDREATEGYAIAKVTADGTKGIITALNCETDFVAKNGEFVALSEKIAELALANTPSDKEALGALLIDDRSINDHIVEMVGKIGEKIEISDYAVINAPYVAAYIHPGNRVVSLAGFNKAGFANQAEVGKDVTMQIAAMAPIALDENSVSTDIIEKELEIAREVLRKEGKPEDKIEMIAQGKLKKFYAESTLLNQDFIKDGKSSVKQYLQSIDKELTVTDFKRFSVS